MSSAEPAGVAAPDALRPAPPVADGGEADRRLPLAWLTGSAMVPARLPLARLTGRTRVLLARGRRRRASHLPVSPSALNEEMAAALLYGTRSGSVSASPTQPPR